MIRNAGLVIAALPWLLLGGCAPNPPVPSPEIDRGIEIRGLLIRNLSYGTLSEVILQVVQTGEFISCGNIPMRGECATTFPLRKYQGNDIEIKWNEGGREWSTGDFKVEPGANIDAARPALVRVVITPAGTALTDLVQ
jgi:hypothetical protein